MKMVCNRPNLNKEKQYGDKLPLQQEIRNNKDETRISKKK